MGFTIDNILGASSKFSWNVSKLCIAYQIHNALVSFLIQQQNKIVDGLGEEQHIQL